LGFYNVNIVPIDFVKPLCVARIDLSVGLEHKHLQFKGGGMFRYILVFGCAMSFQFRAMAQTCDVPAKIEGLYNATCTINMTTDGQTSSMSKTSFTLMQSPTDPCQLVIGYVYAPENQIPYFKVGSFVNYTGNFKFLNFADFDLSAQVLHMTQIRNQTNGQWVEAAALQFENGKPVSYWSKDVGPNPTTDSMDMNCQIQNWVSALPGR
jgi:hypothetical protein